MTFDTTDCNSASVLHRRGLLRLSAGAALLSVTFPAHAETWPTRMITMIVGVEPGGQADIAARPAALGLQRVLGQTVIVENKSGAGGAIGAAYVARSNPDGNNLLMALSAAVVLPEAERIAGRKPPYEMSDFVPIARVLADPNLLAVRASSPYKSVQDIVDDAKKHPNEIAYASSGVLGGIHICMAMFAEAAGLKLLHVPYRGGAPALTGLMAGEVAMTALGAGPLKAYSESGQLRVLATFGSQRHPAFPDAPSFKELGLKDVEFYAWVGLFAPKGVPDDVSKRLREAMHTVMMDPQVVSVYTKAGSPPAYLDAPEFASYIAQDSARLLKVVEIIGKTA
jgi:tripartite-type tricarboxylate transporter receptor subunit TctC